MKKEYAELMQKAEVWLNEHKSEIVAEVQGFGRIPSVSRADLASPGAPFGPDCRKVLDYALKRAEELGFRGEDLNGCAARISMGDTENAIGMVAHLDVVPVDDGWVYPPFGATYLEDRDVLIGRGVDDNKGAAVGCLCVMRMLREFGIKLRHGLSLYCGTSEETGMQDMKLLLDAGHRFPKISLVPDAGFPVNYAQKGAMNADISIPCGGNLLAFDAGSARNIVPDYAVCLADVSYEEAVKALEEAEDRSGITLEKADVGVRLSARGIPGHAASPYNSKNAIAMLSRVLTQMKILKGDSARAMAALAEVSSDNYACSVGADYEDEASGKTTLVYSMAKIEDGRLRIVTDCRYSISYAPEVLKEKATRGWQEKGFTVDSIPMEKPFYIPKEDERVRELTNLFHEATGSDAQPYTMGGGTYSRVVPNAISFGFAVPGPKAPYDFLPENHGGAHGMDEVLPLNKLMNGAKIYLAAVKLLDDITD